MSLGKGATCVKRYQSASFVDSKFVLIVAGRRGGGGGSDIVIGRFAVQFLVEAAGE